VSQETREKIRAAQIGKPKTPEHRANIWKNRKDKPKTQKEIEGAKLRG